MPSITAARVGYSSQLISPFQNSRYGMYSTCSFHNITSHAPCPTPPKLSKAIRTDLLAYGLCKLLNFKTKSSAYLKHSTHCRSFSEGKISIKPFKKQSIQFAFKSHETVSLKEYGWRGLAGCGRGSWTKKGN
jgi:hypothetical protein